MKTRHTFASILSAAIIVSLISITVVEAAPQKKGQKKQTIELKGKKMTPRGAEKDPNIISDSQVNDPNAKIDPPASKGGPKTRGGSACEVQFDNWTKLIIKVYIDGKFRGTIGPFDEVVGFAIPGETRVYARADFDDGTYVYWGPKTYDCNSGQYIYFKMTY